MIIRYGALIDSIEVTFRKNDISYSRKAGLGGPHCAKVIYQLYVLQ